VPTRINGCWPRKRVLAAYETAPPPKIARGFGWGQSPVQRKTTRRDMELLRLAGNSAPGCSRAGREVLAKSPIPVAGGFVEPVSGRVISTANPETHHQDDNKDERGNHCFASVMAIVVWGKVSLILHNGNWRVPEQSPSGRRAVVNPSWEAGPLGAASNVWETFHCAHWCCDLPRHPTPSIHPAVDALDVALHRVR